jgi:hypothetical protein
MLVRRHPVGQECRQHGGADHFTERGLRNTVDGLPVVGDLQYRLSRIMDVPENDRVDVDRHSVLGQGLLGVEGGGLYALVDDSRDVVDDRDDQEEPGSFHTLELAGSEDDKISPGVGHLERERDNDRGHNKRYSKKEVDDLAQCDTDETECDHQ